MAVFLYLASRLTCLHGLVTVGPIKNLTLEIKNEMMKPQSPKIAIADLSYLCPTFVR